MKTTNRLTSLFAAIVFSASMMAEVVYEPLIVDSGFNRDCIAEATNKLSTTDSPIYAGKQSSCFATKSVIEAINTGNSKIKTEEDLAITIESGWPNDYRDTIKCILDAKNDPLYKDVFFLLAPYDQNNVLTLRPDVPSIGSEHRLKFKKVGCYNKMFFLTASLKQSTPSGARKVSAIVYYTDGFTTKDTFNLADGFGGQDGHKVCMTNIYEGSNPGYFDKNTSNYAPTKGKGCASVFEIDLDETKLVDHVDFKNEVDNSAAIIFAVTGRTADMEIPAEEAAQTSDIQGQQFTISWEGVPEAETYRVDVATDEDFQHMVGDYNNLEVSKNDTIVYGLEEDTDYYWRVRSVNAAGGQSASSAPRRVKTAGGETPVTDETHTDIAAELEDWVGTTVSSIEIDRKLYRDGAYNTLCLPFNLSAAEIASSPLTGAEVYEYVRAEKVGDAQLDIEVSATDHIEAGVPYLIKWAPTTPEVINNGVLTFNNVYIRTNEGQTIGGEDEVRFVGNIAKAQMENGNHNNLFIGANNTLYWPNTNNKLRGFRAYFQVPTTGPAAVPANTPSRIVLQRPVPTGIEEEQANKVQSTKVIENGALYIICNGIRYNAQGQVVRF